MEQLKNVQVMKGDPPPAPPRKHGNKVSRFRSTLNEDPGVWYYRETKTLGGAAYWNDLGYEAVCRQVDGQNRIYARLPLGVVVGEFQ